MRDEADDADEPFKPGFVRHLIETCPLGRGGLHGPDHWRRVLENGLRLAEETGADLGVIALFSVLHDSRRQDEVFDADHGRRAAEHAFALRRDGWFHLEDARMELLAEACAGHADGGLSSDSTIGTCWDADRLDLGRVGVRPDPLLLCTSAARRPEVIESAWRRSRGEEPGVELHV